MLDELILHFCCTAPGMSLSRIHVLLVHRAGGGGLLLSLLLCTAHWKAAAELAVLTLRPYVVQ
jgi:hypothetical protein